MNNNTKVRIHLSKQLFESLSREVLAEAKSGKKNWGAGMEEVKTKKAPKSSEMKATNKMKTMDEMSSKEKMAKGLYKEANPEKAKMKKMEEVKKKVMEIAKKHLAGKMNSK